MQELIDELSFIEGLKDEIDLSQKSILQTAAIKNLLEKEKEQIRLAFREGHDYWGEITSNDYYNQTYNNETIN